MSSWGRIKKQLTSRTVVTNAFNQRIIWLLTCPSKQCSGTPAHSCQGKTCEKHKSLGKAKAPTWSAKPFRRGFQSAWGPSCRWFCRSRAWGSGEEQRLRYMKVLTDSWFGITASAEVVILQYQFDNNDTTFMIRTIIITKTTLMLLIKQKKKKLRTTMTSSYQ